MPLHQNKLLLLALFMASGCSNVQQNSLSSSMMDSSANESLAFDPDTLTLTHRSIDTTIPKPVFKTAIDTKNIDPADVVTFAETLIGTPYLYGSSDPAKGFDCSGFITYVFNHFNIGVPRSSVEFTNLGKEVALEKARAGDLVLFTGTDSTIKVVGHMGIVVDNKSGIVNFVHSSSGKAHGVTISPIAEYYRSRYIKTIRIFN